MSHNNEGQRPGTGNSSPRPAGSGPSSPPPQRGRAMSYDPRTLDLLNTIDRAREQAQGGGSGPSSPQGHDNTPNQLNQGEPAAQLDPALRKRPRSEGQDGQQLDVWRNRGPGGASSSDASHRSKRQRLLARSASSNGISRFLVEELANRSPQVADRINVVTELIENLSLNSNNSVSSSKPDSASSTSTGSSSRPDSQSAETAGSIRNLDRPERPRRGFFSYQQVLDRIVDDADTLNELLADIVVDNFYGQLLLDVVPDPNNPGGIVYLRPDPQAPRPGEDRHPLLRDTATSALREAPPAPNSSNDSSGNWAFGRARDNDSGNQSGRENAQNMNRRQIGLGGDSAGSNFSNSSGSNVGPGSSQSHTPPDSGDTSPASPDSASSDSPSRPQDLSSSSSSSRPDSATKDSGKSGDKSGYDYYHTTSSSSRPDSATKDTDRDYSQPYDTASGGHSNRSSSRPDSATRDSDGNYGNSSTSSSRPDSATRDSGNSGDSSGNHGNSSTSSSRPDSATGHSGNSGHRSEGHGNSSSSSSRPDSRTPDKSGVFSPSNSSSSSRPDSTSHPGTGREGGNSQSTSDYYLHSQGTGGRGNNPAISTSNTYTSDYYLRDAPNPNPVAGNFAALLNPNREARRPGDPFDINEFRNDVLRNSYREMDERINNPERMQRSLRSIWNMVFPGGEASADTSFFRSGSSLRGVGLYARSEPSVHYSGNYNINRPQPVASSGSSNTTSSYPNYSSSRTVTDDRRTESSNSNSYYSSSWKSSGASNSTGNRSDGANGVNFRISVPSPGNHGSNNQGNTTLGSSGSSASQIPRPGQYADSNSTPPASSQPRAPPNLRFATSQERARARSITSGGANSGGRQRARSRSGESRGQPVAAGPSRNQISPEEVERRRKLAAEISRDDPQRTARALVNEVQNSPDQAVRAINYAVDRLAEEMALLRFYQLEQGRANSEASGRPEWDLKFDQEANTGEAPPPE